MLTTGPAPPRRRPVTRAPATNPSCLLRQGATREQKGTRMTSTNPSPPQPNPNDRRADRALQALRAADTGEPDTKRALARLLTDIRHLCHRFGLTIGGVTQLAADSYRGETEAHGAVRRQEPRPGDSDSEPLDVVTIGAHATNHYRASVLEICGDSLGDTDTLLMLWLVLCRALTDGRAAEDPDSPDRRLFFADETRRATLARQLIALRIQVRQDNPGAAAGLSDPDGGFEQFLI